MCRVRNKRIGKEKERKEVFGENDFEFKDDLIFSLNDVLWLEKYCLE